MCILFSAGTQTNCGWGSIAGTVDSGPSLADVSTFDRASPCPRCNIADTYKTKQQTKPSLNPIQFKSIPMKRILLPFLLVTVSFFHACVGPMGPPGLPGPQGPQGQPGVNIVGEVFEVTANFTAQNNYQEVFSFTPPIFNSDVVMAYLEWEVQGGNTIWRALPQTVFHQEGTFIYNFDFTRADFSLFLDSNFEPGLLENFWTRNQKFRIIIIPGEFANARLDLNDYEGVMKLIGATEDDVKTLYSKN